MTAKRYVDSRLKLNRPKTAFDLIDIALTTGEAAIRIERQTGINLNLCMHCRTCAGGCPFLLAMDYMPNQLIRLIQYDRLDEALSSATIWSCVACNTCSAQCPMAIDIPALIDALRQMAIQNKVPPADPDILIFHQEIQRSIAKHGRTHKVGVMLRYKLKTRRFFSDLTTGMRLFAKHKLGLLPSVVRDRAALNRIMNIDR